MTLLLESSSNPLSLNQTMLKAISTHVFLKHRLHGGHLDSLAASGAEAIEIFSARQHFDYTARAHVSEIADWFGANPVRPWALHAPLYADLENGRSGAPSVNVVHVEKSRRIDAMDEVKRALESAEQIPFAHLILHLGERGETWSARTLEHGMAAVEHLGAFARPLGVQILLENLENNEVAQPENLMEILTVGRFKDIGVCLDVGHAHLAGSIPSAVGIFGERLRSTHIHDNAGDRDAHMWPGEGTIDWPEAMQALAQLAHPPATVLEISSRVQESGSALTQKFRHTFELLEMSAQPTQV
jgi:sugar phosphate isomerase/epimerase